MAIDGHTHIFCWGENPEEGWLSETTRRSLLTRTLMFLQGIKREEGETMSDKLRNRLFRDLESSNLDGIVLLAQDAVYRPDGSRDESGTHFYVSNDYVFRLASESDQIIPCPSVNPHRADALQELERCFERGARIVKVHTAIQGVDPSDEKFDPFYRLAADLDMTLMFHTGYEHACTVISQEFTDPARLARPLDHGLTVIAAHCGTCAFFDPEDYYPNFVETAARYPNLYGDTSIMAALIRPRALKRLESEPLDIRKRVVHGSDYPLPPSRVPHIGRVGLFPPERKNILDMDLAIKQAYDFGPDYETRILDLLGEGARGSTIGTNVGRGGDGLETGAELVVDEGEDLLHPGSD